MDQPLTPLEQYIVDHQPKERQTVVSGSEAEQTESVESKIRRISYLLITTDGEKDIGLSQASRYDFLAEPTDRTGPILLSTADGLYFSQHGLDKNLHVNAYPFKRGLTYEQILGYWADEDYFNKYPNGDEKPPGQPPAEKSTGDLFAGEESETSH